MEYRCDVLAIFIRLEWDNIKLVSKIDESIKYQNENKHHMETFFLMRMIDIY